MRRKTFGIVSFLGFAAVAIYYLVMFFSPKDFTRPTSEFYVNDYADVLSSATKDFFISKSDEVFTKTKGDEPGGLQIVVATYKISSESEIDEVYNKTNLYRKWAIGENDMGLLFIYYYQNVPDGTLSLHKISTEIGYRLTTYLTATAMGQIIDKDFAAGEDEETAQAHAYSDVLAHVLPEAYGIEVTPFDKEAYLDYQIQYDGPAYGKSEPLNNLQYAFANNDFWSQFGIPLVIVAFTLLGDIGVATVGGGGSSGGAGVSRWRH